MHALETGWENVWLNLLGSEKADVRETVPSGKGIRSSCVKLFITVWPLTEIRLI